MSMIERQIRHYYFIWKVAKFEMARTVPPFRIYSGRHRVPPRKRTWELSLRFDNGDTDSILVGFIMRGGPDIFAKFRLGIQIGGDPIRHWLERTKWISKDIPIFSPFSVAHRDIIRIDQDDPESKTYICDLKIKLEVSYNEKCKTVNSRRSILFEDGMIQRGIDLSKYVMNEMHSDLTLIVRNGKFPDIEFPIHKAIIRAWSINFLSKYCNENNEIIIGNYEACFFLFYFFYTGNINMLIDIGPLPLGLHEIGKEIKNEYIVAFTKPTVLVFRTVMTELTHCKEIRSVDMSCFEDLGNLHIQGPQITYDDEYRMSYVIEIYGLPPNQWIVIFVHIRDHTDPACIDLDIALMDTKNELVCRKKKSEFLERNFNDIGVKFLSLSDFNLHKGSYNRNGKVEFSIEIRAMENKTERGYTKYNRNTHSSSSEESLLRMSVLMNLMKIKDGACADLRLKTEDGTTILAHRVMLAARSKLFSEMIRNKLALLSSDNIHLISLDVPYISGKNLEMLLEEIYTGRLNVEKNISLEVYKMAHTFELDNLKERCRYKMKSWMNSLKRVYTYDNFKTCLEFFTCADTYRDDILKGYILEEIGDRSLDWMGSTAFKCILLQHTLIANRFENIIARRIGVQIHMSRYIQNYSVDNSSMNENIPL